MPDPSRAQAAAAGPAGRIAVPETAASRLLRPAALLPILACLLTVLAPPLNHDAAAVLTFSERWLAGERLYADLIDVNPPLIFMLNLLPAAIGAWTPVSAVQALPLCLLGFCAASAWLALRLAAPGAAEGRPVEAACLAVAVPLLTLAAGYDFAQREHIMAVAALPYLALAARRMEGVPTRLGPALAAALPAAAGFALKPHFLAIPALVEALVLARRGPAQALRDPVPWAMALLWLAYLAAIPLVFPAYLTQVLPLAWAYYLGLGDLAWWQVVLTERLGTALLPLSVVAFRGGGFGALPRVLAAAGLGAALAAIVQHKGWTYHALPARLFAGLLAVVLAARWLDRALPAARARRAAPAAAVTASFALYLFSIAGAEAPWREITWSWSQAGRIAALLQREAHGERLLVLSPDIHPVHPALNYAQAQSSLRTMNLWLLQGIYAECPAGGARYRETWEMSRAEFFLYRTVAEDFARAPPAAVLVALDPRIPACGGRGFDVIAYFSRHPLFAATFRRYRPGAEIAGYRLYRRED